MRLMVRASAIYGCYRGLGCCLDCKGLGLTSWSCGSQGSPAMTICTQDGQYLIESCQPIVTNVAINHVHSSSMLCSTRFLCIVAGLYDV